MGSCFSLKVNNKLEKRETANLGLKWEIRSQSGKAPRIVWRLSEYGASLLRAQIHKPRYA